MIVLRDVNKCWLNVCCVCTVWTLAHGTVHESNCLLHSTDLSIISRHLIYCQIYTELQRQLWGAAGFTYPKGWRTPKFSRLDARYQRSCLFPHWKIRTIAPPPKNRLQLPRSIPKWVHVANKVKQITLENRVVRLRSEEFARGGA